MWGVEVLTESGKTREEHRYFDVVGTLRSVSHDEKVAEARVRANMSGVIIKKSDGLTTQQIKQSFYPTQPTPASDPPTQP